MKFCLLVAQGPNQGKAIAINKPEFVIGRDPGCHLRPASQTVSKRHCALRLKGERAFVEDLKSTNGTFINDAQLQGEKEIKNGDRLRIGPLDFRVQLEATVADGTLPVDKRTPIPPAPPPKAAAPPRPAAPAAPAPAAKSEPLDEDSIGSLLLSLSDEERVDVGADDGEPTDGSTIMQLLKPEEMEKLQTPRDREVYKPSAKQGSGSANTGAAAKAILERYKRKPAK